MVSVASQVLPLSDRRFFTGMALAMAAVTFIGFGPTYYLAGVNDARAPVLTASVHVHGALNTIWVLLLVLQTSLIAAGQRRLHTRLGVAGVLVAAATLVSGLFVAINSERRIHTAATADTLADPYVFLIFPFTTVWLFAAFAACAVLQRHRSDAHKRLMLLATVNLIGPALARIVNQIVAGTGLPAVPGVVGAAFLINLFPIAMALHDYRTRGRVHPVTLWGGALILVSEPIRFAVGYSEPWQAFARALMS